MIDLSKIFFNGLIPVLTELNWKMIGLIKIVIRVLFRNDFHIRVLNIQPFLPMNCWWKISSVNIFCIRVPFLTSYFNLFLLRKIKKFTNFFKHFFKFFSIYMVVDYRKEANLPAGLINSSYCLLTFLRTIILFEKRRNVYFGYEIFFLHMILMYSIFNDWLW